MRIGIDLDNTIINYENSYSHFFKSSKKINKQEIKKILFNKKKVDKWQSLQSKIYSKGLKYASCYDGVLNFLQFLNNQKIKFFIISHKSIKPYTNEKINLRKYAKKWIDKNIRKKIKISEENIFFEDTNSKKLNRIKSLKLDYFIDDLENILINLPNEIKKIYFNPYNFKNKFNLTSFKNWNNLYETLFVTKNNDLTNGVNNYVKVLKIQKKKFIFKKFEIKTREINFKKEVAFLKIAEKKKIKNIPKILHYGEDFLIMNYIEGKKINLFNKYYIKKCLNFLSKLNRKDIKNQLKISKIGNASDNCNDLQKSFLSLENRIALFKKNVYSPQYKKKISDLLNNYLIPEWKLIKKDLLNNKIKMKKLFKKKFIIFSPSDFGSHNMKVFKKKLFFFDFEYAGFDNSFKLISDFISHPDHVFKKEDIEYFIKKILIKLHGYQISNEEMNLIYKLILLHKLKWCLVILNPFLRIKKNIREFAGQKIIDSKLKLIFIKSKNYYRKNFSDAKA
tara:strand:+ start:1554 stop:3071 length:1518 start_codon:yes stop_codon:yes gene_type:complete